jgi:AcrR family transcriptional regulator
VPVLGLRADARRNRDQLLVAARDAFVEQGLDAPLDDIARRAGVGIATLYRRFPDRLALQRAVAIDVLRRIGHEASLALEEEPDAFAALARYMHRALDARVAAVMPALGPSMIPLDDAEFLEARDAAVEPVLTIIARAQRTGVLRPDVTFGDIGLVLIRLSRPLPSAFPPDLEQALAHRHLDLFLAGLRGEDGQDPLSGPALRLDDLRAQAPNRSDMGRMSPVSSSGP